MTDYRIFETADFLEDLDEIPHHIKEKIGTRLKDAVYPWLRLKPHFGPNIEKLKDWKPETWRYRLGSWRLFYEIEEDKKTAYLLKLVDRKDAY